MTRRDLALIVLAGAIALVVAGCVTALAALDKVEGETAVATLATVAAISAAAIGRLSGGPQHTEAG